MRFHWAELIIDGAHREPQHRLRPLRRRRHAAARQDGRDDQGAGRQVRARQERAGARTRRRTRRRPGQRRRRAREARLGAAFDLSATALDGESAADFARPQRPRSGGVARLSRVSSAARCRCRRAGGRLQRRLVRRAPASASRSASRSAAPRRSREPSGCDRRRRGDQRGRRSRRVRRPPASPSPPPAASARRSRRSPSSARIRRGRGAPRLRIDARGRFIVAGDLRRARRGGAGVGLPSPIAVTAGAALALEDVAKPVRCRASARRRCARRPAYTGGAGRRAGGAAAAAEPTRARLSFGFGVPLRPRVGGAADLRSGALAGSDPAAAPTAQ